MVKIAAIVAAVLVYLGFQSKTKAEEPPAGFGSYRGFAKSEIEPIDWSSKPVMSLDDLYAHYGQLQGLDPLLLKAIAQVESNENPDAKNPNDPSYGLMQLLCKPDGQGSCSNRLNVLAWPPHSMADLYDPDYSLKIASQILSWNIDRYGFLRGIACYNAWSAHTAPENGPFPNQGYVDKVLSKYRALGGVGN